MSEAYPLGGGWFREDQFAVWTSQEPILGTVDMLRVGLFKHEDTGEQLVRLEITDADIDANPDEAFDEGLGTSVELPPSAWPPLRDLLNQIIRLTASGGQS